MVNVEYKVNTPLIVKPLFNNLWCRCDLSGRNGDEPFNILCIITHNISIKGKKTSKKMALNIATNIEKGIFNYSIKDATSKKIVKKWNNVFFVQIYMNRVRTIISNFERENSGDNPGYLLSQIKEKKIKLLSPNMFQ